jgi:hypothetical protein
MIAEVADLDHDESGTGSIGTGKVHISLVVGDVEALNTAGAGLKGTSIRGGDQQEGKSGSLDGRSHSGVRVGVRIDI